MIKIESLDTSVILKYGLLMLLILLPYHYRYASITIVIMSFGWLLYLFCDNESGRTWIRITTFLLPAIFLLYILSAFYSSDLEKSLFLLEKSLSFIIFPVIFLSISPYFPDKYYFVVKQIFIGSVLVAILFCWSATAYDMYEDGASFKHLFHFKYSYRNLHKYLTISGIHFALFIITGIIFCLDNLLSRTIIKPLNPNILLTLVFTMFLLHLGSRMSLVILIFVFILFFTIKFYQTKSIKIIIVFIMLLTIIVISAVNMPYLKIRILEYGLSFDDKKITLIEKRIPRWNAALDVIRENWIIGVGSGDTQEELLKAYDTYSLEDAKAGKLNAHNQYIQMALMSGVVGLLIFVLVLGWQVYLSIKYKSFTWLAFILCVIMASMTESLLHRQKSIILFSLFTCMFIKFYEREKRSGGFGVWIRGSQ